MAEKRADRVGSNRTQFEKNARYIYKTQEVCGICGLPVDKDLKSPDPMSKTIDHIIPVSKGGHPSDLANLQLAHRCCNRQKGNKLYIPGTLNRPGCSLYPGLQNNPGPLNDPGTLNNPGTKNNQDTLNDPDRQNNSGLQSAGAINPEHINTGGIVRGNIDNNNLPQHADWSEYKW